MKVLSVACVLCAGMFCSTEGYSGPATANGIENEISTLRKAIVDLTETYGERYPDGERYLNELENIEGKIKSQKAGNREKLKERFYQLRREALIANPSVSGQPILYVVRAQYLPDHHSTATLFQNGEINTDSFRGGGALKTIHLGLGGVVQTLVDAPEGIVRDPEVSFD